MFFGNTAAAVYANSCLLANRPVFILCHASCQQRHLKNNFHTQKKDSAPSSYCSFLSSPFQTYVCSSGKVSNGELRDELNLKCLMVPWVSIYHPGYMHRPLQTPPVSTDILHLLCKTQYSPKCR